MNIRPTPTTPRAFSLPEIHRQTLDNGLTVAVVPMPGRTLCAAELVADAGAAFDAVEGTATLLARAFNEGTAVRDAAAFADASEALGMQLSASASWDALSLSITVPVSRLGAALALMAEAAWTPSIPQDGFDRLRAERLVQIQQEAANPAVRAAIEFPRHAYTPDSTYARSLRGTTPSITALTRDDVVAHHERFVSPGSSTLVVAGDVDPDEVVKLARAAFGGFTRPEADRKAPTTASAIDAMRIVLVDRPGSVQSQLVLGHRGVDRLNGDLDALRVMNYTLGGSFSSRINQRLREELGYTYGARSDVDPRRAEGPIQVSAPVQSAVTAPAIEETLRIVRAIATEGVTDAEATSAKDYLAGVYPLRFETTDAIASAVANLAVYGLPDRDLTTYPERIRTTSREQASDAASTYLHPDELLVVVVGPADEIKADLEAIAPVAVVTD